MPGILVPHVRRLSVVSRSLSPGRRIYNIRSLRGLSAGDRQITGIVTVLGQPASRKVRCYDLDSGRLAAEVWSTPNGDYTIQRLMAGRRYCVIAHDHTEQYNAAIADLIEPEPMA